MRLILIMRRRGAAACVIAITIAGVACDGKPSTDATTVDVVAAFYPLAEASRNVGGDDVRVTNVTAAGAEPHDVELSPDAVDTIEDADVVVFVGGGFQPALEKVAARRGDDQVTLDVLDHVESQGDDPHFWLDPVQMVKAVDAIETALSQVAPGVASSFAERARDYRDELGSLDRAYTEGLATCDVRAFVTAHAAFGYLAARYDLEQVAIAGLSPEAEPDPRRLDQVIEQITARGIDTVFSEDMSDPGVAEAAAREAGVRVDVLSPLEGLSAEQADGGADYISVMRENLAALRRALRCR